MAKTENVGAQTNFPVIGKFMSADFIGGSALLKGLGDSPVNYTFEPQRRNNGYLFAPVPEMKAAAQPPFGLPVLGLALKSMELPKDENEIIDLGWFNQRVKFAGQHRTDDITLTFVDYADAPVMHLLEAWRSTVYNPEKGAVGKAGGGSLIPGVTGGGTFLGGYKWDVYLMTFSPNINWVYTKVFRLKGAFPTRLDRGELDYDDDERSEVTLTLSYDEVTYLLHGYLPEAVLYYAPQAAGEFTNLTGKLDIPI